ncbi:hypothetical protein [Aeromicrobium sp. UC242_57]
MTELPLADRSVELVRAWVDPSARTLVDPISPPGVWPTLSRIRAA